LLTLIAHLYIVIAQFNAQNKADISHRVKYFQKQS